MNVLDLFSGIGGFSLGLERTGGFKTVAFCEIDPFCRHVLAKHWPNVRQYEDVRELTADRLAADGIAVDAICGGFPCQDISTAGKGAGIEGDRSGLWSEYARIIGDVRPRYVIVENVAALLGRGLDRVLGDLAAFGFDAEWHCIPASAIGAPHRRDRIWIISHDRSQQHGLQPLPWAECENAAIIADDGAKGLVADAIGSRCAWARPPQPERWQRDPLVAGTGENVADSKCGGLQGGDVECARAATILSATFSRHCGGREYGAPWWTEPDVGRVAYGVPNQVDRLASLGNAVVPQIPEIIGRAIMKAATPPAEGDER